ncbi:sigma factor [Streptomyces sp. NPDC055103]
MLEPLRGELYRYCRRLTGSVRDAEDLAQEMLARAPQSHQPVQRPPRSAKHSPRSPTAAIPPRPGACYPAGKDPWTPPSSRSGGGRRRPCLPLRGLPHSAWHACSASRLRSLRETMRRVPRARPPRCSQGPRRSRLR